MKETTKIEIKIVIDPKKEKDIQKLVKNLTLSEEQLERLVPCLNKTDWSLVSKHQRLSESFIEKHADKVDWHWISRKQKLSEQFIERYAEKFANKIDWYWISKHRELSESFIEKYADKVNWFEISRHQKLSPDFIIKYLDKLIIKALIDNKYQPLKNLNSIQRLRVLQATDEITRKALQEYFQQKGGTKL